MKKDYVHGYSQKESKRLTDQANTLADILHYDTIYPENSFILEAGCGVGSQTIHLAKSNPNSQILSVDISEESLEKAKHLIDSEGIINVEFEQGDIFNLKYDSDHFDHVFLCFVLEHLPNPAEALENLKKVLKPNGTITVIEGDHESTLFYPPSEDAMTTVECLIRLQANMGGDGLIGRSLYPLLNKAGFKDIKVSPRTVYADESKPELVDGFTKKTYIAMVEGVKEQAIKNNLITLEQWDKGIKDLYKSSEQDGVFYYTFFKGIAVK